ncbi:MAG: hypothetical protein P1V36_10445 [Planctomycetota bacterium]|nr:hypothetical protein [Planctomycetota bacterium]
MHASPARVRSAATIELEVTCPLEGPDEEGPHEGIAVLASFEDHPPCGGSRA